MRVLCKIRLHRWFTFYSYTRGVSLCEEQKCRECGARRVVWDGGRMVKDRP